jgi:2-oxoglutarate ferredoxin oxidoreductase subunit beta
MHNGSTIMLRKVDKDYDPRNRGTAIEYIQHHNAMGEIVTGLLYIDEDKGDMHELSETAAMPLRDLPYERLNPGREALRRIQRGWR